MNSEADLIYPEDEPTKLYIKYFDLYTSIQSYFEAHFAPRYEGDPDKLPAKDLDTKDFLMARAGYAMYCVNEGKPVPDDCKYDTVDREFKEWISYKEQTGDDLQVE
jgi:hypothetical protein